MHHGAVRARSTLECRNSYHPNFHTFPISNLLNSTNMKISPATTTAVGLLALSSGANAIDFDFRNFEGLWEGVDVLQPLPSGPTTSFSQVDSTGLVVFNCEATGDFRKAVCKTTSVVESEDFCFVKSNIGIPAFGGLPAIPPDISGHFSAVSKCEFMLDQFDADTGKTDVLMCSIQCCGSAEFGSTCSDYPMDLAARQWNFETGATLPDDALGPQILVEYTMLPGKNNNNVRAIEVVSQLMTSDDVPSGITPFKAESQIRKTAGGFKSYE